MQLPPSTLQTPKYVHVFLEAEIPNFKTSGISYIRKRSVPRSDII